MLALGCSPSRVPAEHRAHPATANGCLLLCCPAQAACLPPCHGTAPSGPCRAPCGQLSLPPRPAPGPAAPWGAKHLGRRGRADLLPRSALWRGRGGGGEEPSGARAQPLLTTQHGGDLLCQALRGEQGRALDRRAGAQPPTKERFGRRETRQRESGGWERAAGQRHSAAGRGNERRGHRSAASAAVSCAQEPPSQQ